MNFSVLIMNFVVSFNNELVPNCVKLVLNFIDEFWTQLFSKNRPGRNDKGGINHFLKFRAQS